MEEHLLIGQDITVPFRVKPPKGDSLLHLEIRYDNGTAESFVVTEVRISTLGMALPRDIPPCHKAPRIYVEEGA